MWDGPAVAAALKQCPVTDVLWIPDSDLGRWDQALSSDPALRLIRVCREGEAVAIAGGLYLGGRQPLVILQCTGLFEAGDSLRNFVFDLKLPLFFLIGVRNWNAYQQGRTSDTCPIFTEPIVQAWRIPYTLLTDQHSPADLVSAYRQAWSERRAGAVLLAE